MKNSFFRKLRKLGKWKETGESFVPPKASGLVSPEEIETQYAEKRQKRYEELKKVLKEDINRKIRVGFDCDPDGKYTIIAFGRHDHNPQVLDSILEDLVELGWEIASRVCEREYLPPWYEDDPYKTFTKEFVDICVARRGELSKAIEGTDFVVFGKEPSTSEKEQQPSQNMGKDELLKKD